MNWLLSDVIRLRFALYYYITVQYYIIEVQTFRAHVIYVTFPPIIKLYIYIYIYNIVRREYSRETYINERKVSARLFTLEALESIFAFVNKYI